MTGEGAVDVYEQLTEVIERRRELGMSVPSFHPTSVPEHIAERWLESLTAELEVNAKVRRLIAEQYG